ncbi:FUSC family protein [Embleya sp. NBC_00896]|uniref:FUSC family protein n=1 Tax=Embleya sp. NBC_00896 TaxID=2975961 RepID=UPI00386AA229|nr:aromatic acid exporter family protein [Embleya sp. NBC_00896]
MPSEAELVARLAKVKETETSLAAQVLRTTVAAVVAYVAGVWLTENSQPILAPLTALLVVQVTAYATLTNGLRRVASVVAGVLIAVLFSEAVGLNWWSLALLLVASLGIGHLARLEDSVNEVAISAMIVLGVSQVADTAWDRIAETLIGAAVGMAFSLLLAPPVHVRPANEAVMDAIGALSRLLDKMAREITVEVPHARTVAWLEEARRIDRDIVRVDATLSTAEEGTRLNPRGRRVSFTVLALRSGLDALEISAVALRTVCRSLTQLYQDDEDRTLVPRATAESLRSLFHALAALFSAYGYLVVSQGQEHPGAIERAEEILRERQEQAEADRRRTEAILLADTIENPDRWELYGTVLASVDKLADETRAACVPGGFARRVEERGASAARIPVRERIRRVLAPRDRLVRVTKRVRRHAKPRHRR